MEAPPENLHDQNDHVLEIPNDGQHRNSREPVIQPTRPGGSSHGVENILSTICFLVYIKLVFNIAQIVASVVVLVVSSNEKPQAPLFTWIVGYAAGCAARIPLCLEHCFFQYPRLSRLLDNFRWIVKACFFVWFVVGNVWLFGGDSSSGAPNLHRLCITFLVFCYIEFTLPFILCAVILYCCEDLDLSQGAASECINSLPTYIFKLQKDGSGCIRKRNPEVKAEVEAAGGKDRSISGEDAVCCICLANYADNDVLKELPCSHLFHTVCVDKWLKLKAICPLCKRRIYWKK
ncbi:hypothetical protein PTKIN_Ptkin03bG0252800 [Pterospermum kingtungense]